MKYSKNPRGREYKRIVNRGCGGYYDYWGEFDCSYDYDWTCDNCPCCIEINPQNIHNQLVIQIDDVIEIVNRKKFK